MTHQEKERSVSYEATVFWLVVNGIVVLSLAFSLWNVGTIVYSIPTASLSIACFVVGFFCWRGIRIFFPIALAIALILIAFTFGILYSTIGTLLFFFQLQVIFFAYRAYREYDNLRTQAKP